MRSSMLLAVALLAVGCGPRFRLDQKGLTCNEGHLTWAGGLTNHVLQGSGKGDFAYDPVMDTVDFIDGFYDLDTGDFWWQSTYADGLSRVEELAQGYGTLWPDGDLDIEYALDIELVDGRSEDFVVRERRLGCDLDVRVEHEDGDVRVYEGQFTGGQLEYVHTWTDLTREYEAVGTRSPDGTWTEELAVEDGDFEYRLEDQGDFELSWRRDFRRVNAYTTLEGELEQDAQGATTVSYTFEPASGPDETWSYTIDLLGEGEGTLDYAQQSCSLSFSEGKCTASGCNRDGRCQPPLEIDEVLVRL